MPFTVLWKHADHLLTACRGFHPRVSIAPGTVHGFREKVAGPFCNSQIAALLRRVNDATATTAGATANRARIMQSRATGPPGTASPDADKSPQQLRRTSTWPTYLRFEHLSCAKRTDRSRPPTTAQFAISRLQKTDAPTAIHSAPPTPTKLPDNLRVERNRRKAGHRKTWLLRRDRNGRLRFTTILSV